MSSSSSSSSSSPSSIQLRRVILIALVVLVVVAALQVESVDGMKQDLLFIKGKFIKKDKKGVIVVDDKCHSCCHHGGHR